RGYAYPGYYARYRFYRPGYAFAAYRFYRPAYAFAASIPRFGFYRLALLARFAFWQPVVLDEDGALPRTSAVTLAALVHVRCCALASVISLAKPCHGSSKPVHYSNNDGSHEYESCSDKANCIQRT